MRIVTREFQLTLQEYFGIAFGRLARRRGWWWLLLIAGGKAIDIASRGELAAISLAAILIGVSLPLGAAWNLVVAARKPSMADVFRPRVLEIDDQGLFVQETGGNSYSLRWNSILQARTAAGGWEIVVSDQLWFFIPSRAFERDAQALAFDSWVTSGLNHDLGAEDATDLTNPPRFR